MIVLENRLKQQVLENRLKQQLRHRQMAEVVEKEIEQVPVALGSLTVRRASTTAKTRQEKAHRRRSKRRHMQKQLQRAETRSPASTPVRTAHAGTAPPQMEQAKQGAEEQTGIGAGEEEKEEKEEKEARKETGNRGL
jgi:hypothetical protein